MAPHPIPVPCALAVPSPSHRNAATPSPCWAPFMTQERLMFSNPIPSELHLSVAATMSDDMLSALTPCLPCASILQPATPPQVVAFYSWTISTPIFLNRFTRAAKSRKPDLWTCVHFLPFPLLPLLSATRIEINFNFKSLFALWSLSTSQQFHCYFYLIIVSWRYQKY